MLIGKFIRFRKIWIRQILTFKFFFFRLNCQSLYRFAFITIIWFIFTLISFFSILLIQLLSPLLTFPRFASFSNFLHFFILYTVIWKLQNCWFFYSQFILISSILSLQSNFTLYFPSSPPFLFYFIFSKNQ